MVKGITPDDAVETPPLHDVVEAAFEEHMPEAPVETSAEAPPVDVPRETDAPPDTPEVTAEPRKNASGRLIGSDGRFVKKLGDELETPAPIEPEIPPEVIEAIAPPTSWKKDHYEAFAGLDPALQAYINQRESEYSSGVSTYKTEYDRIKPLDDAMAPFMEDLQANNIDPGHWVSSLGNAHVMLAKGNPQQKLSMFMKLANDYQVPVQSLFAQGEDGKLYYNPQVQQHQEPQPDVNALVENKMAEVMSQQQIQQFAEVKDGDGNPLHPHYATVRETMAQLLEARLADDLDSAYAAALRHPRHAEIFDAISKQEADTKEAARLKEIKDEATRARSNAISPKSGTPAAAGSDSSKGVRASIVDAMETVDSTSRI